MTVCTENNAGMMSRKCQAATSTWRIDDRKTLEHRPQIQASEDVELLINFKFPARQSPCKPNVDKTKLKGNETASKHGETHPKPCSE